MAFDYIRYFVIVFGKLANNQQIIASAISSATHRRDNQQKQHKMALYHVMVPCVCVGMATYYAMIPGVYFKLRY